jgi:imidazolonepropionase-like amidohydrolase
VSRWLLPCLLVLCASPVWAERVAITHATVLDMAADRPRPDHTVVIEDGSIVALGPSARVQVPADARVVDGRGRWLMPALWDMHVHLANRPEPGLEWSFLVPSLLAHGVVGVRDMGSEWDRIRALRDSIAASRWRAPEVLSPGPFVDGAAAEAGPLFRPVADARAARAAVRSLHDLGVDFIKIQSGLSADALRGVREASTEAGLGFAGHVPEALRADEVLQAGARSLEHISPALPGDAGVMRACSADEDSLLAALAAFNAAAAAPDADRAALRARQASLQAAHLERWDDGRIARLARQLRDQGAALCPTLVWSASFRALAPDDSGAALPLTLVPRSVRERALAGRRRALAAATSEALALNARVAEASARLVGRLHAAGAPILAGTDSFDAFCLPGDALHAELEWLVRGGLTPLAALRAATVAPARFLGRARTQGTIERGRRADLMLLDADPLADIRNTRRIAAVVAGGRVLDRAALDALLAGVRARAEQP